MSTAFTPSSDAGRQASTAPAAALQFLRLAAAQEHYAVRVDAVREILEVARLTPLPLMPAFVRGVMNLRGAVVPVIDLGARLGRDAATIGRRSCVVVADIAAQGGDTTQRLGMLVDAVFEVVESPSDDLEAVPRLGTRIDPSFIRSMVRVRGQALPELDVDAILDQATLAGLIELHATTASVR